MGYTHRYAYDTGAPSFQAAWPQMVADAQRIVDRVEAAGVDLHDLGCEDDDVVPVDDEHILINGSVTHELDGEPLVITRTARSKRDVMQGGRGTVSAFCKTNRMPYDLAVSAILLRCHVLAPDAFHIDSDGEWDGDWDEEWDGDWDEEWDADWYLDHGDWDEEDWEDHGPDPASGETLEGLSPRNLVAELFGDVPTAGPFTSTGSY